MEKEQVFVFIITFFSEWGWQALGKIANPVTGKVEKNLNMVQQVIDILETLREKTKGNITGEEKHLLDSLIADLQLNYVEEIKKEDKKDDKGKPEEKAG